MARGTGLRERKKQATREALREAALRLAVERGLDNVRVDDIADAAGVSPRTYNNYYSSREQAIVAAVTAGREARVATAVLARPASVRLADAVADAIVEQYAAPSDHDALLLVTTSTAVRAALLDASGDIEDPLSDVFAERLRDPDGRTARVLAAAVAAAVRVALERWLQPSTDTLAAGGFAVVSGSLEESLRGALEPLVPALDAASGRA